MSPPCRPHFGPPITLAERRPAGAPAAPMPWAADAAPPEDQGPTVPPLPAVWGQRVTEAAARLLETVTEPGCWPDRPNTVRDGVALKGGITGLPSSLGQQCFDAPPGAVLRKFKELLRDPELGPQLRGDDTKPRRHRVKMDCRTQKFLAIV